MENYSVEYPDFEDTLSSDKYSPLPKLKPSKQHSEKSNFSDALSRHGSNMSKLIKLKDTLEKPKFISPDRKATSKLCFQKKSESTYESHFNTICERRAKSKTVLGGPVARYPHKSTINELALYYRAKQVFENNTNKTVDEIKLRKPNSYDKQKVMLKNKIRFLETNIDRPKILPLQDTLDGVFSTNAHLHNEQRKGGRYKIWAGLRYPANIKHTFNKHKDKINHWDEIRDGVFHEL